MSVAPTLVILAAGMGSRYGGMKQIDGVGSHGEPIIEFSIYDAYQAGFRKVVLIIKREHEELFRKALTDRIAANGMEVAFAYQDINNLPSGFTAPKDVKNHLAQRMLCLPAKVSSTNRLPSSMRMTSMEETHTRLSTII